MRALGWISAVALIAVPVGCESVVGPGGDPVTFEVIGTRLDPDPSVFVIDYRVENRGSHTVYLTPRCGDTLTPAIYGDDGAGWSLLGSGACFAVLDASPWPLGPGETVSGSTWWQSEGRYELRLEASDRDGQERITLRSGPFVLD